MTTITDADRKAAADLWINVDGDFPTPAILSEAERYRQGIYDHTPAVQAFARHREAALEEAAKMVDGYVDRLSGDHVRSALVHAMQRRYVELATAIRALKGNNDAG